MASLSGPRCATWASSRRRGLLATSRRHCPSMRVTAECVASCYWRACGCSPEGVRRGHRPAVRRSRGWRRAIPRASRPSSCRERLRREGRAMSVGCSRRSTRREASCLVVTIAPRRWLRVVIRSAGVISPPCARPSLWGCCSSRRGSTCCSPERKGGGPGASGPRASTCCTEGMCRRRCCGSPSRWWCGGCSQGASCASTGRAWRRDRVWCS